MKSAYRQSALLLHGLADFDREWILAQLAEDQRDQLNNHLAELRELGLPAESSLTEALLAERASHAASPGQSLRSASPEQVLQLLKPEPASLCASVLAIESWPWQTTVYDRLSKSKPGLQWLENQHTTPPRLARALIRQLEERLGHVTLTETPTGRPGPLTGSLP